MTEIGGGAGVSTYLNELVQGQQTMIQAIKASTVQVTDIVTELTALVTGQTAATTELTALVTGQTAATTELTALVTGQTAATTELTAIVTELTSLVTGQGSIVTQLSDIVTAIEAIPPVFVTPPASAGSAGVPNQLACDGSFLYVCIASSTWKRVAIATWP